MNYSRLAMAVGLVCLSGQGYAREYSFDATLLDGAGKDVDVSLFEQGGQLPGTYTVDILLNGERVDARDVVFSQGKDSAGKPVLVPCLSVDQLSRYGVKVEDFPALIGGNDTGGDKSTGCANLGAIAQANAEFNFNAQALNLMIPQASLRPRLQGIAPEQLWDDGVPALLLNWQANTSRTELKGNGQKQSNNASYAQLQPGANLGAWRLRNATTWQKTGQDSGKWQTVYTYAERGLYGMKSRLTLGERSTPGDIFDSVPFRGVMLNSDESMVPSGLYSYAPVVRGIARTQARVEVKQNGYTLYSGLVAPGPFALTDLTPTGSGGDLEVTVHETDGSNQVFTVPYQTPAIALREGYLQYSLMAGQYRPADGAVDKKMVYQATAMYGLPWNLTAYTGAQVAEHYQAGSLGLGVSFGDWGAFSLDATETRGKRRNEEMEKGRTWRARYSKQVVSTNTTFTLASYQYASTGYSTLSDVLDTWRNTSDGYFVSSNDKRRTRTALTVSQALGDYGYLTLTGSRENYWNKPGHNDTLNAGYSIGLDGMTVSLNWSENKNTDSAGNQRNDRVASVWLSVPLERWLGGGTNATYRWTTPSNSSDSHEVGLNGRAFNRQLYWDVRQRYRPDATNNDRDNSALRMTWYGGYGQVGGSYSHSRNMTQMGADAAGGIVAHPGGVTFGQPLGETVALVEAPGASGVSVGGWPGVRTDWRGFTTLAYLTPYQENRVTLNPAELPPDAEITQTDTKVVPTQGAVIPAKFATRIGGRALMTLTRADGAPVPYGALATLEGQGVGAGVVGDDGQVYLTGLPNQGEMTVKWTGAQCRVTYTLPAKKGQAGIYEMRNVCR
ncbi:fimbrial biogenesis outer membrane usher protein [Serratia marcescens]|uniref:fimbrial biogenesis outer membrane usher protein n=1 Tax=Serratia marcescens TaxID=615 RepID=UPI003F85D705